MREYSKTRIFVNMNELMTPRGGKRPGAGRPPKAGPGGPKMDRKVEVPLSKEQIDWLDEQAEKRRISRSEFIRNRALKGMPEKKKKN